MVLAAGAASGLPWELGSGAGFMWMGRGLRGLRGLLGLRPVVSLKGILTKAVEVYGGYEMQMMRSDDNIILNMFARKFKRCQCQNSSIQASESRSGEASVLVFFIPFCACKCR